MISLIIQREFFTSIRSKGSRITLMVIAALALIGAVAIRYFAQQDGESLDLPTATGMTRETNVFGYFLGTLALGLLLFCVVFGVSMVNQGVVEEKQNRVVETILTTVKPRVLLTGKILGIGLSVFVQFTILIFIFIAAAIIMGITPSLDQLHAIGFWTFLPTVFIWVVLGFLTFAGITGAFAATVSRQEDLGSISMLFTLFAMVPFYVALYLTPTAPDSPWNTILTYVPIFSPSIVPMRAAMGQIGLLEQIGAMATTILAIALLAVLAGKIYERSVLHTGSRLKVKQIFSK